MWARGSRDWWHRSGWWWSPWIVTEKRGLNQRGCKTLMQACWVTVSVAQPGKWVDFGLTVELDWDVVGGLDQVKDG